MNSRKKEVYHRHHRKPSSIGGTSDQRNISILPKSKHTSWHYLFGNLTAERIVEEINRQYIDPDYELIVVRKTPKQEETQRLF